MAENQADQQGSAELLKSCFELQEVADRWSNLKGRVITVDEILDYEAQGILRIAARTSFYDKIRRETRSFVFTRDGKTVTTTKEEVGEFDSAQALYYPPQGTASLLVRAGAVARVTGLTNCDFFGLTSYKLENDPPLSPFDITLKREALRITREELQRFEREYMRSAESILTSAVPGKTTKGRPGRPKNPDALNNRLDELKADAIKEAGEFKNKHGTPPMLDDIAGILAHKPNWRGHIQETIKTHLRAAWWK